MWKVLLSCLIILTSVSICNGITRQEWVSHQERQIDTLCDTFLYGDVYCRMASYRGLNKVLHIMEIVDRDSMEWEILQELMEKHYIAEFDTFNFKAVHEGFEKIIKEKE